MKRRILLISILMLISAMLSACDQPGGCNVPRTIELTQEDNGETISMNLEDTIKVVLPSNPTTGFQWVNMLTEGSIIVQVGDSVYKQDPDCNDRPGCGGTETFFFEATQTGTGAIKLLYMQTWENDPAKEFAVTIQVK